MREFIKKRSEIVIVVSVSLFFFFCASFITYPLIFRLHEYVTGWGDELLITWILNWNIHSFTNNPITLFQANTYYPYLFSLAYSDAFITSSILAYIPVKILSEPIVAFNFTFISSLALLGISCFYVCYMRTRHLVVSLIVGLLIMFSPAVLDKKIHLQILAVYFVPLSFYFMYLFLSTNIYRYCIVSIVLFLIQTYNSFLPGYFIIFSWGILIALQFFYEREKLKIFIQKKIIVTCLISMTLLIPLIYPYLVVSSQYEARRDIRDAIHLAIQPEDFWYTNEHSRLEPFLQQIFTLQNYHKEAHATPGYLGAVFSILAIVSTLYFLWNRLLWNFFNWALFTSSVTGFVLSFGPALHWNRLTIHDPFPIPLPYAVFYFIAPGFQGFRNSARWEIMGILFLSIFIGIVLTYFFINFNRKYLQYVFYSVAILLIIVEFTFPMQFVSSPPFSSIPSEYKYIATLPRDARILELPIHNWYNQPFTRNEILRQYYSIYHFRKMVNGASGYAPDQWMEDAQMLLHTFPSDKTIRYLDTYSIEYVVIHVDEFDDMYNSKARFDNLPIRSGNSVKESLLHSHEFKKIWNNTKSYIFKRI